LTFLTSATPPYFLMAGGGGGTTRALAQGVMEAVEAGVARREDVRLGCLRMGSGNLVAAQLGVARDGEAGLRGVAESLSAGRVTPLEVIGCAFLNSRGESARHYALALGGVGPLARVPGDVHAWKTRHRDWVRRATRLVPLERVNHAAYAASALARAAGALANGRRTELVEVEHAGHHDRFRALVGVLVSFDCRELPVRGAGSCCDGRMLFCFVSRLGRVHRYTVTRAAPIEVSFPESETTVVALDEDLFTAPARMRFEHAATLNFVPGHLQ
jgi:hypothetical protein